MARVRLQAWVSEEELAFLEALRDRMALPMGELLVRIAKPYYDAYNPAFPRHPIGPIIKRRRRIKKPA